MFEPNMLLAVLLALVFSALAYIVGCVLSSLDTREKKETSYSGEFEVFFVRLVLGTLLLTLSYACFCSMGRTILMGTAIPLLVWLYRVFLSKGSFHLLIVFPGRIHIPSLSVVLCYVVALLALIVVNYYQTVSAEGVVLDMNQDYAYYASVANNLMRLGVETTNPDFANPELIVPMYYRYGELWLAALLGHTAILSLYYTLLLVVFPLLGTVALMGLGALFERTIGARGWQNAFAVGVAACLTLISFKMFFYHGGVTTVAGVQYTSLLMQRFYLILIAFIFAFLVHGYQKIAVICIAIFWNPAAVIPILVGAGVYLMQAYFRSNRCDSNLCTSVAMVVGSSLYFFGFYILSEVPNPYLIESYSIFRAFQMAMWQFGSFSLIEYAALPLLDAIVNLGPYMLLLLFVNPEKRKDLLIHLRDNNYLIYILLAAIVGFAFIWYIRDSLQVYYAVAYPLFIVVNSMIVVVVLFKAKLAVRILAVVVVWMVNIRFAEQRNNKPQELDKNFYTKIASVLSADTAEHRFAWVEFKELCDIPDIFLRDAAYRKPLYNISRFENSYTPMRLDVFHIAYDMGNVSDRQVISAIENSSFYRYVSKNKMHNKLIEAQNNYLREHKIRYVIVPRGLNWFEGRGFKIQQVIESKHESYSFYILAQ